MIQPVMEFNLWYSLPTLLFIIVVVVHAQRKRFNRKSYSKTQTLALLNIVIFGPFVLSVMFGILVTIIRIFLTNPFWFPWTRLTTVVILRLALVVSAYLYVLILAWGKKIEEVEPDCQESTEEIATQY